MRTLGRRYWKRDYTVTGIRCSDEQVNPFLGIYSAVTRRSFIDGVCYIPEERLTVYEAVSLFTTGSAYAIGKKRSEENYKRI